MTKRTVDLDLSSENTAAAVTELRRRRSRNLTIMLICAAIIPLSCASPLSLYVLPRSAAMPFFIAALALPFVGLAGVLLMLLDRSKYSRALACAEQAQRMGLNFLEKPPKNSVGWLTALKSYAEAGYHGAATNLLTGTGDGRRVTILDYHCAAGDNGFEQTVFILEDGAEGLPDFVVNPKSLLDKVVSLLGSEEVRLPGRADFSKKFAVLGEDEEAIRTSVTEAFTRACTQAADQTVELFAGRLIVQRYKKIVAPKEYPERVAAVIRLAETLPGSR